MLEQQLNLNQISSWISRPSINVFKTQKEHNFVFFVFAFFISMSNVPRKWQFPSGVSSSGDVTKLSINLKDKIMIFSKTQTWESRMFTYPF